MKTATANNSASFCFRRACCRRCFWTARQSASCAGLVMVVLEGGDGEWGIGGCYFTVQRNTYNVTSRTGRPRDRAGRNSAPHHTPRRRACRVTGRHRCHMHATVGAGGWRRPRATYPLSPWATVRASRVSNHLRTASPPPRFPLWYPAAGSLLGPRAHRLQRRCPWRHVHACECDMVTGCKGNYNLPLYCSGTVTDT